MNKGDSVILQNLQAAAHLNGKQGTVDGFKGDRLVVCLENGVVGILWLTVVRCKLLSL